MIVTTETAQTTCSTSNNNQAEEDFKTRPDNKALAMRTTSRISQAGQAGFTITVRETLETGTTRDLDLTPTDTPVAVSTAVTGDALTGISGSIGLTNDSFPPFLWKKLLIFRVNDPSSGKHFSLTFLPATPSSQSQKTTDTNFFTLILDCKEPTE